MALFTINRYLGDEGEEDKPESNNHAQSILAKIHQQAQLRKRLSLSSSSSPVSKDTSLLQHDSSSSSDEADIRERLIKTKKRKRMLQEKNDTDSLGEAPEKTPKKKLKRTETPTGTPRIKVKEKGTDTSEGESSPLKAKAEKVKTPKGSPKKKTKIEVIEVNEEATPQKKAKKANNKSPSTVKTPNATPTKERTQIEISEEARIEGLKPDEKVPEKKVKGMKTEAMADSEPESGDEDDVMEDTDSEMQHSLDGTEGHQQNKNIGGFTVIGDVRKKKVEKVLRVLPDWLANPALVSNSLRDTGMGLGAIPGLEDDLLSKLRDNGIKHFFPVQRLVIPVLLGEHMTGHLIGPAGYRPSDICCSAPTGSGKTLAFVLPIVQALRHCVVRRVRALVLLPGRDLASQVFKVFATYCKGTNIKVCMLIGQKSFKNEQQNLFRKGLRGLQVQADIVVATPGRLVDHIKGTEGFDLHHLRYLVIDEADRMMDDIKQDWLSQVEQAVYGGDSTRSQPTSLSAAVACKLEMPLQKLLFSATLSQNPEKLQQLNLFHPKLFSTAVETLSPTVQSSADTDQKTATKTAARGEKTGDFVGKFTTPAGLSEYLVMAREAGEKPLLLLYFLHQRKFRHMLVFTNSIEATHRLYHVIRLVGGLEVAEFSSSLHALQRSKILKKFAAGKIDVLICSDAMARGMDVENVQCVLSYDHSPHVKTYIHRIGRTARAGKVGTALTLLERKEVFAFKKMVREAGKEKVRELKITKGDLRGLLPDYQRALRDLPAVLQSEKKS